MDGVKEAKDNDIVIISDLDEIPNFTKINFNNIKNKIINLGKKCFTIN